MKSKYYQELENGLLETAKKETNDKNVKLVDYDFNADIYEFVAIYKTSKNYVVAWIANNQFTESYKEDSKDKAYDIFHDLCNSLESADVTCDEFQCDILENWVKRHAKAFRMKYICDQANINYDRYKNWNAHRLSLNVSELKALQETMENATK